MCFRPPFVDERESFDHPLGFEIVMPAEGVFRAKNLADAKHPYRTIEIEVDGRGLRVLVGRFGGVVEGET